MPRHISILLCQILLPWPYLRSSLPPSPQLYLHPIVKNAADDRKKVYDVGNRLSLTRAKHDGRNNPVKDYAASLRLPESSISGIAPI